jgi:predicted nucleotidyltransferase
MERQELLRLIKQRLEEAYGARLKGLVLYGSEARGEAGPDSDYDFLVLLEGPVKFGQELRRIINALYPLQLDLVGTAEDPHDRLLDARPVDSKTFENAEDDLYQNARKEGIRL